MSGRRATLSATQVDKVSFKDEDGDEISFSVAPSGEGLLYQLNGSDRGVFKHVKYAPGMGVAGLTMPDIKKGFPIPRDQTEGILSGLKHLAAKAEGVVCDIADEVVIPDGTAVGLPNEVADSLFNMRSTQ